MPLFQSSIVAMLLTRGDALRSAQRLPLAFIFRAFGAVRIEFRDLGQSYVKCTRQDWGNSALPDEIGPGGTTCL